MSTIDIIADRLDQLMKRFESIELQLKDGSTKFSDMGRYLATLRSEINSLKETVDLKIDKAVNPLDTDMKDTKIAIQNLATKSELKDVKEIADNVDKRLWMIVIGLLLNAIGVIVAISMSR